MLQILDWDRWTQTFREMRSGSKLRGRIREADALRVEIEKEEAGPPPLMTGASNTNHSLPPGIEAAQKYSDNAVLGGKKFGKLVR